MRRVRSDVSHRIRRRPSIFSTRWFRVALGVGVLLVVALLVGPSVASWFGGDLPRSLSSFVPWGGSAKTVQSARTPDPVTATPRPAAPAPSTSSSAARGAAGTSGTAAPPSSGPASESPSTTAPRVGGTARSATAPVPPPATTAPASPARDPAPPRVAAATPAPGALAAPPAVYWVQVGAFLDHKNADRLVEKLKGEGLSAATTSFEQSRVLYRVILVGWDGGRVSDDAIERAKGLGHPVEATPDGPAVTGLVPLRKAVETSHSLRQQGVPVRLKQEVSSSTFRVVRVGSFTTAAEADAALAQLSAKGVEGVVVREQR
jgi:cell division protein FtsN